jgi:hypothetical protein
MPLPVGRSNLWSLTSAHVRSPCSVGVCATRAWPSRCVRTTAACMLTCIMTCRIQAVCKTTQTIGTLDISNDKRILYCERPISDSSLFLIAGTPQALGEHTGSLLRPKSLTQLAAPNHFRPTTALPTRMCKSAPVTDHICYKSLSDLPRWSSNVAGRQWLPSFGVRYWTQQRLETAWRFPPCSSKHHVPNRDIAATF